MKPLYEDKIQYVISKLRNGVQWIIHPWRLIAIVIFVVVVALVFTLFGTVSAAILSLLFLQCLIAIGLALSKPKARRTYLGIVAAILASMVTGWLWWQQWTSSEETNATIQSQSLSQKELLEKTTKTLSMIDSAHKHLLSLERIQSTLDSRTEKVIEQLQEAGILQDSLNRITQARIREIRKLQFPIKVEQIKWSEVDTTNIFKDFFRSICECYPHANVPGRGHIESPPDRSRPCVTFWYKVVDDTMMGVPIELEDRIYLPRGSNILKYLHECYNEWVIVERENLNKLALLLGRGDSINVPDTIIQKAIYFLDSLQALRWGDMAWLQTVKESRRKGKDILLNKALEELKMKLYTNSDTMTMRYFWKLFESQGILPVGYTNFDDSLRMVKVCVESLMNHIKITDSIQPLNGTQYMETRMFGAMTSLGFGHPGVRWFSIFRKFPEVPTAYQWSSDNEAEETFLSGDLSFIAVVPGMELFDFHGHFQRARDLGRDSLMQYYFTLAEKPWPVDSWMDLSEGTIQTDFNGTAKLVNNTGRIISICDLEDSWLCTAHWQDIPAPEKIELVVENGKTIQLSAHEFNLGPYGWRWAHITRKHLKAFPTCADVDENFEKR